MAVTPRLGLFLPVPTTLANPQTILNDQYQLIDDLGPTVVADSLPVSGAYDGQLVYVRPTGVVSKWNLADTSWYYVGSKFKSLGVLGFKTITDSTVGANGDVLIAKALIPPAPSLDYRYKTAWSVTLEQNGTTVANPGDTQLVVRASERYDDVNNGDPQVSFDYCDLHDTGIANCPQMFSGDFTFTPTTTLSWMTVGLFLKRGGSNAAQIRVNAGGYDSFYVECMGAAS